MRPITRGITVRRRPPAAARRPAAARILVAVALAAGAGLAAAPSLAAQASPAAAGAASICPDANVAAFGPDVCVFTPAMSQAAVQSDLNAIAAQQVPVASQFSS